jgi:hypothetical protein
VLWVFCLSPFKQDSAWDEWRGRLVRALLFVPAWIVNVPLAFVGARLFRAAAFCYDAFLSTYSKRRVEAALVGRAQAFALWLHDASRRAWAAISRQVAGWNLGTGWDGRVRRMAVLFEIALTAVVGVVTDRLWRPGALEAIDGEDFRGWLRRHGGTEESINSAYIKCWYDAVVAYDDGDPSNPSISAAVTLYAGFRALATYKGNFAFQMRHEVGDGVIAPLVQALVNRGVTFQFLHRVRDVVPGTDAAGRPVVQEIVLEPQLPGRALTRLFVENAAGRPVWPDSPQVAGGLPVGLDPADLESFYTGDSGARWTLRRAAVEDGFDEVVFALPVPVVPHDAGSLVQGPGWRRMVQNIKATESLSLRIWFRWSLQELGWDHPTPILSGYQFPFSTWEDNSHNITNEGFPPGMEPRAIATVFGPLPAPPRAPAAGPAGDTYLQDQRAVAAQAARDFFQHAAGHLWPKLLDANGQLQYDAFCDLRPAALQAATPPAARLDWQLLRANVGPVERYTMALPRTLQDRLRPDESGYVNMVLAGEWTRNGVEVGSVEGAMVSGLAAARALGGYPPTIPGERDLEFGLGAAG